MHIFKFDRPEWFGLCMDMQLVWGNGSKESYVQAVDTDGQRLVFVHAGATGVLGERLSLIRSLEPDVVICCFPRQAKRLYPDLPVLGNWPAKTRAHGCGMDHVLCIEEDTR